MPDISIIIPALNEGQVLPRTLVELQIVRGKRVEIILVDGGSADNTVQCAEGLIDRLVLSTAGRAVQMNKGAEAAQGKVLLFLHADTLLPKQLVQLINEHMSNNVVDVWGRFNVKLDGRHFMFRIIETMMNWRSCLTGIVTGDHAMFVSKHLFERVGGYPTIALMEDIAISQKLKRIKPPVCINNVVVTSSRRWEQAGIIKTIIKMWSFRLAYLLKINPSLLAKKY